MLTKFYDAILPGGDESNHKRTLKRTPPQKTKKQNKKNPAVTIALWPYTTQWLVIHTPNLIIIEGSRDQGLFDKQETFGYLLLWFVIY